jgi:hypothetical protein
MCYVEFFLLCIIPSSVLWIPFWLVSFVSDVNSVLSFAGEDSRGQKAECRTAVTEEVIRWKVKRKERIGRANLAVRHAADFFQY